MGGGTLMKKKYIDLLKYLSNQNTASTSNEIANVLQISPRSVKNFVHDINSMYGKKIILSSRSGYTINSKSNISLLLNENTEVLPQTNEERSYYIIKQLFLNHSSSLDIFDVCDYLCVSYSTIRSLLSKMNKTFSSYHIEFTCENEQICIKGNERDKRKLISYVINEEYRNSLINTEALAYNFKSIDVFKLHKIIQETFKKHNFYLNDFSSINILLHLCIILDRKIIGSDLHSGSTLFHFDSKSEKDFLMDLHTQLEQNFHIVLNDYELFDIYMIFKANANCSLSSFGKELGNVVGENIIQLTEKYVQEINNYYMIDLSSDSFKTPFALHLKNLIFRAKENRYTANSMAQIIRTNSPLVFDIAIFISLDLMEQFNITINEDETAFLAMHIGAEIERQSESKTKVPVILICPDYHDMSKQITNFLLINFGNQLNLCSVLHEESLIKTISNPFAIIFTTIPLRYQAKENEIIVPISPIDLSSQIDNIQRSISKSREIFKDYKLRIDFHDFFEKDLFIVNNDFRNKEQVLTFLCDKLINKNYVDSTFEEKVYQRENAATTAFGNVAIPHSADMDAIKTSVSVFISKRGINWGQNTVYVILLLAINKADRRQFRYLYESLISFFAEPNIIQDLRNCTSFKDFENFVYTWIDQKEAER